MVALFLVAFFITLILVRVLAYLFHDMEGYGTKFEKSKTLTGILRKRTGFDWHHAHFGFVLLFIAFFLSFIYELSSVIIVLFAVGLSMILDQIVPLIGVDINYFSLKALLISIILHFLVFVIVIFSWSYF